VTVEDMMKIAPDEYRLDLDAGVLYAKTEQPLFLFHNITSVAPYFGLEM